MADENRNDLVLSPNEYAYVLDTTKALEYEERMN